MTSHPPPPDPGELLRRFRSTYTNYYTLWTETGSTPDGVELRTPERHPLAEHELPPALQEQLQAYRRAHPDRTIVLIKHMRSVNGSPRVVIEDERDLPEEAHLLTFSQTVTLNAADTVEIITDLYVAQVD